MTTSFQALSRAMAFAVALILASSASAHQLRDPLEKIPIAAAQSAAVETVTGIVHRVTIDDRVAGAVVHVHTLVTDDGRKVRLQNVAEGALTPGARVRASGRRNGKALFVDAVGQVSPPPGRDAQHKAKAGRSVTGKLALLHVDYFDEERSDFVFEVHAADGTATPLQMDVAPEALQSGMEVTASGETAPDGSGLVPDAITITALAAATGIKELEKAVRTNNVLVILMTFADSPAIPFSQAQVQAVIGGGPGSGSVSEYFREASFGQQLMAATVTPWLATGSATPTGCNWTQMGTLGRNAAVAAGYNLGAYQNLVYVFPPVSACGWIGLGYVGASGVWINGRNGTSVYGHELGHNFGLLHAASLRCSGVPIGGACTASEYGDPFDIMGNQSAMHFSAPQKLDLGWIGSASVATHGAGTSTYVLNPIESSGGSLYAVKIPAFGNRTYWLEFRQPIGFDAALASYPNNGVQIRVASPFETLCPGCDAWSDDTELLDMTPGTSTFTDAALTVGKTFSDSTYGISVAVLSATAAGVTVRVTAPGAAAPSSLALSSSANPAATGARVVFTATITGNAPTGTVTFTADGAAIAGCSGVVLAGAGNTKSAACGTSALAAGAHSIVASYGGDSGNGPAIGSLVETIAGTVNVALASNGAVASASSTNGPGFLPSTAIDDVRSGAGWGNGGGWNDATPAVYPDWLQINFAGSKTIDRVVVYSVQDNYLTPVEPTATMPFSLRGLVDFDVQAWNGAAWVTVASVSANNLVKRNVTFPATTTDRIRIMVNRALGAWTRITEVEAWAAGGPRPSATATTITSSSNPVVEQTVVTLTAVVGGAAPTGSINFVDNGNSIAGCNAVPLIPAGSTATASCSTAALGAGSHTIAASYGGDANNNGSVSASLSQLVTTNAAINVALAANGGVASASSTYGPGYAPSAAIDNVRTGASWGNGGGWNDATPSSFPDWLQIGFAGTRTIDRVVVYSVQDDYLHPTEPTDAMTFSLRGIVDFSVQAWTGASWTTVAAVTRNNLVKRTVSFPATSTSRIRIVVSRALAVWTRITEVEAWGR